MLKPRVLIYDIETSPITAYLWGVGKYDRPIEIIEDYQILSVAWHWLGDNNARGNPIVSVVGQDDFGDYIPGVNNDTNVVEYIHGLYDEADIVIAHNGNSFDQKKSQARMMLRGMAPPSPYKQIDTYRIAKKYAAFNVNRLGGLAEAFGVAQKGSPGGFETWKGCLAGDPKAWAKMKRYNRQDIPPLVGIYKKFLPWIENHPSMSVIGNKPNACPKCFSTKGMQSRGLTAPTKTGRKQRFQCTDCWGWSQGRITTKSEVLYVN